MSDPIGPSIFLASMNTQEMAETNKTDKQEKLGVKDELLASSVKSYVRNLGDNNSPKRLIPSEPALRSTHMLQEKMNASMSDFMSLILDALIEVRDTMKADLLSLSTINNKANKAQANDAKEKNEAAAKSINNMKEALSAIRSGPDLMGILTGIGAVIISAAIAGASSGNPFSAAAILAVGGTMLALQHTGAFKDDGYLSKLMVDVLGPIVGDELAPIIGKLLISYLVVGVYVAAAVGSGGAGSAGMGMAVTSAVLSATASSIQATGVVNDMAKFAYKIAVPKPAGMSDKEYEAEASKIAGIVAMVITTLLQVAAMVTGLKSTKLISNAAKAAAKGPEAANASVKQAKLTTDTLLNIGQVGQTLGSMGSSVNQIIQGSHMLKQADHIRKKGHADADLKLIEAQVKQLEQLIASLTEALSGTGDSIKGLSKAIGSLFNSMEKASENALKANISRG